MLSPFSPPPSSAHPPTVARFQRGVEDLHEGHRRWQGLRLSCGIGTFRHGQIQHVHERTYSSLPIDSGRRLTWSDCLRRWVHARGHIPNGVSTSTISGTRASRSCGALLPAYGNRPSVSGISPAISKANPSSCRAPSLPILSIHVHRRATLEDHSKTRGLPYDHHSHIILLMHRDCVNRMAVTLRDVECSALAFEHQYLGDKRIFVLRAHSSILHCVIK